MNFPANKKKKKKDRSGHWGWPRSTTTAKGRDLATPSGHFCLSDEPKKIRRATKIVSHVSKIDSNASKLKPKREGEPYLKFYHPKKKKKKKKIRLIGTGRKKKKKRTCGSVDPRPA
jgi:hypothetical protein